MPCPPSQFLAPAIHRHSLYGKPPNTRLHPPTTGRRGPVPDVPGQFALGRAVASTLLGVGPGSGPTSPSRVTLGHWAGVVGETWASGRCTDGVGHTTRHAPPPPQNGSNNNKNVKKHRPFRLSLGRRGVRVLPPTAPAHVGVVGLQDATSQRLLTISIWKRAIGFFQTLGCIQPVFAHMPTLQEVCLVLIPVALSVSEASAESSLVHISSCA